MKSTSMSSSRRLANKHILCIDDDADVVLLVKDALESQGYEVCWAFNGQESLDIANCYY